MIYFVTHPEHFLVIGTQMFIDFIGPSPTNMLKVHQSMKINSRSEQNSFHLLSQPAASLRTATWCHQSTSTGPPVHSNNRRNPCVSSVSFRTEVLHQCCARRGILGFLQVFGAQDGSSHIKSGAKHIPRGHVLVVPMGQGRIQT